MVTVYTMDHCQACKLTKRDLTRMGVPYQEVDIQSDPELIDKFVSQGLLQAPIVVKEDGEAWSGFNPTKLKALKTLVS